MTRGTAFVRRILVALAGLAVLAAPPSEHLDLIDPAAHARLKVENARLRERLRAERARSGALESELIRQGTLRLERELAWREFQGELTQLRRGTLVAAELAAMLGIESVDERAQRAETVKRVDQQLDEARARADAIRARLNARLRIEGFDGFDVFDMGLLASDAPASSSDDLSSFGAGPVVVRLLDHRGILCGSLIARRLHLEASRGGHSLTIVLTGGSHREGDYESAFTGGVYRIPLRHVDPQPFIDDCGPLFESAVVERVVDDGRWSLPMLSLTIDRLLAERPTGLRHRLLWIGGVVGDEFRDVELAVIGEDGREVRRLIADGMTVELHSDHVRLVLRDGLSLSGDARAPFLDGRMRIVLTGADPARWRASRLPFVDVAAAAHAATTSDTSDDASSTVDPKSDVERGPGVPASDG